MVGIICSQVDIGLTDLPKTGELRNPPASYGPTATVAATPVLEFMATKARFHVTF